MPRVGSDFFRQDFVIAQNFVIEVPTMKSFKFHILVVKPQEIHHMENLHPRRWISPCQDSAGYTVFHAVVPRSSDNTKRRGDDVDNGTIWLS